MNKYLTLIFVLFMVLIMDINSQGKLPKREEISDKYKWNLSDIYPNNDAWLNEYNGISNYMKSLLKYQGIISKSSKDLLECINLTTNLESRLTKLYIYSTLGRDTDLNNPEFMKLYEKIQQLYSDYSSLTSFIIPEIQSIDEKTISKFYNEQAALKEYKFKIDRLIKNKKHTLSPDQEKLLSALSPVMQSITNTYNVLNDADLPFPTIKDGKGNDLKLSHGRYRSGLYSQDRNLRREIYKGTYQPYKQLIGTMASLYNGRVKERITNAKIRNYSSALEAATAPDNIPLSVYENLIKVTNENVKTLQRWGSIKKRVLKLDELHPYDTYVSLFPGVEKKYDYETAVKITLEALKPLGEEYINAVKLGFENRWLDVYETEGKRSGAYSNSSGSGPHPFILLNWNNTMDDLFTLVHEVGHNMHSFFTEKTQPYQYGDYATFVAEVASTANESLLLDYLIEKAESKEEKMALIENFLIQVQTTYFRQTQFAEFEKLTHDRAEKGEILSAEQLSEEFGKGYIRHWGPEMKMDDEEKLSWARIHHLINYNFYVYQYATGKAASTALVENIKKDGKPAIDKYLKFLSSGSSKYPIDILKDAGVDMTTDAPVLALIKKANKYLDQLEEMLK
jgi:oligoendopeptidase F